MFSIGENGDIYIHDDNTFTDIVIGDYPETEFRIARSRVISRFKFKNFFNEKFIKYYRNNFTDEYLKEVIDLELDTLFSDKLSIRNKINYFFKNESNKLNIIFLYKESNNKNRNLLFYTITL